MGKWRVGSCRPSCTEPWFSTQSLCLHLAHFPDTLLPAAGPRFCGAIRCLSGCPGRRSREVGSGGSWDLAEWEEHMWEVASCAVSWLHRVHPACEDLGPGFLCFPHHTCSSHSHVHTCTNTVYTHACLHTQFRLTHTCRHAHMHKHIIHTHAGTCTHRWIHADTRFPHAHTYTCHLNTCAGITCTHSRGCMHMSLAHTSTHAYMSLAHTCTCVTCTHAHTCTCVRCTHTKLEELQASPALYFSFRKEVK